MNMETIQERVARVRAEIRAAALACGRDPGEIALCAATKMNDAEAVRQAIAAGVDCLSLIHIYQVSMLDMSSQAVCQELQKVAVETLTPIEAMNLLFRLKQML